MMENYDETRIVNKTIEGVEGLNEINIQQGAQLLNCNQFKINKQNFNFGAEIFKTITVKSEIEKTATMTSSDGDATIEMAMNVEELSLNNASVAEVLNESYEDDEEDGTDSYQTTDDDNDHVQHLGSHDRRAQVHASQEESDESSTDSDFSDLSGLSDVSGREWKPISARPINWVQKQIHSGANPRELLSQMLPSSVHQIAPGVNDMMLWRILASMLSEPPRRQKLRNINTFEDVIQLVLQSQNIIVLTGAGVSVSCGIPDFRSSDGIYSRLAKDFPDLPDPQAMFDINYFSRDPRPFYKFAREIYPGQFKPSPCHRFIKLLEQKQKLLRNYTQNIDTLEQVAGIRNVIECHGSFSTASCTKCKFRCDADDIRSDIFVQRIPVCPRCQPNVQQSVDASDRVSEFELKRLVENGIMKPDIVFFGEGLPEEFHTVMASDKDKCDLLIVVGSSLKVRPVALIPSSIPANVPQILINREQLHHLEFDVELLGDSDVIINQLCHRLGSEWREICFDEKVLKESKDLLPQEDNSTEESEEDVQQLQDTDTQSVKSNASTDVASRSAGTYSDSGFESSTSSGGTILGKIADCGEAEKAIEKIKSSILGLNDALTNSRSVDLLPSPDILDEQMEVVDFGNPDFHPFSERLGQETPVECIDNCRHLSIDSSKDSGIQCDSSNFAVATSSTSTCVLQPPLTKFGDSGGTTCSSSLKILDSTSASQNLKGDASNSNVQNTENKAVLSPGAAECELKRRQQKRQCIAERLPNGTYYCYENNGCTSYVFPGAQVSWSTDSEEDDEENEYDDETDGDTNAAPLSPLLPPSVEAEMVSEITTTTKDNAFSTYVARHSIALAEEATAATVDTCYTSTQIGTTEDPLQISTNSSNTTVMYNRPLKRRHDSIDSPAKRPTEALTASITTTTINSTMTDCGNSLAASSPEATEVAAEVLLQHL